MQVQNLKPESCYKMVVTDEVSARLCLRGMVRYLGMGFHADSLGAMYVNNDYKQTFEKFESEFYDSNLLAIHNLLGDSIHLEAMELWHEFGMITNYEYEEMSGDKFIPVNSQRELLEVITNILYVQSANDCTLCSSIYPDVCAQDSIGIRWMEADGTHKMNSMIEFMDTELYKATGRHFSMTNNSPTDGFLLVFWESCNDEQWDRNGHKHDFIRGYDEWLVDRESFDHRPDTRTIYRMLEQVLERECYGPLWREVLNPDHELWCQVVLWDQTGISNPNPGGML